MKRKRIAINLVLTALFVVVCRCGPPTPGASASLKDGTLITCTRYTEYTTSGLLERYYAYEDCVVPCPDGSTVQVKDFGVHPGLLSLSDVQGAYCPAAQAASAPLESPTATATATDTETAPLAPPTDPPALQPVLAGSVTVCDTGLQYINFPLADPLPDLTGKSVSILLNGVRVKCKVAGSDQRLLGCTLPSDTVFPLLVTATIDGEEVNNFSFDGAICTRTQPSKVPETEEESAPPVEPTPDCDVNPDPFNC